MLIYVYIILHKLGGYLSLKKSKIYSLLVLSTFCLSFAGGKVEANHVHHHKVAIKHVKKHKRVKKVHKNQNKHKIVKIKIMPKKHYTPKPDKIADGFNYTKGKITDSNVYHNLVVKQSLAMTNDLRLKNNLNPLTENPTLDMIADMRAKQEAERFAATNDFTHYNENGEAYVDILAHQYIGSDTMCGENLASQYDPTGAISDGKILTNEFIDEGPENGDGQEHGHYMNMIDSNYSEIGTGFAIVTDKNGNNFEILAQDFI